MYNFSPDLLYKQFYESNSELDSWYRIVNVKGSLKVNIKFWQNISTNKNVVNITREEYTIHISNNRGFVSEGISKLLYTNRIEKAIEYLM